jgi:hypothetical protein
MFAKFDCCILHYIKNNCCRFNLETMTFILDLKFLTPQHLLFIATVALVYTRLAKARDAPGRFIKKLRLLI